MAGYSADVSSGRFGTTGNPRWCNVRSFAAQAKPKPPMRQPHTISTIPRGFAQLRYGSSRSNGVAAPKNVNRLQGTQSRTKMRDGAGRMAE